MKLTIAICAHNAEHRIAGPMKALAAQTLPSEQHWEVLLIDNGSNDRTSEVARSLNAKLQLPLRIVHEPQLGLTYARTRAAKEATGKWLAFCDDDNLPAADWLENVLAFADSHPGTGIFGGRVVAVVERPELRPETFADELFDLLGCCDRGPETFRLEAGFPPGAGMVMRRDLLLTICNEIGIHSVGRQGAALTGCEDAEIGIMARTLGWELWYCGNQNIEHLMPPHRVRFEYRDALSIQAIRSAAWLQVLQREQPPRSRTSLRLRAIPDLLRAAKYVLAGFSPLRFHRKSDRLVHWRKFYAAKAGGWFRVAADFQRVNQIIGQLHRHACAAATTPSSVKSKRHFAASTAEAQST